MRGVGADSFQGNTRESGKFNRYNIGFTEILVLT
jgi:hypothetical protein